MKIIRLVIISFVLFVIPFSASFASNYSYSYLGLTLSGVYLDQPIIFNDYKFDRLGGALIVGSYQFIDKFSVFYNYSRRGAESCNREANVTENIGAFGFKFINSVDSTDMNIGFASLNTETELCVDPICTKGDDSGKRLMFEVRHMVNKTTEFNLLVKRDNFDIADDYATLGFGVAFYFYNHHSVRINFTNNSNSDKSAELGYLYSFGS